MTRLRLRHLVIAAENPGTADTLKAVLDLGKAYCDPAVMEFGIENAVFPIGDQFIEVIWPATPDAPVRRFLQKNGAGGYMALFQTDNIEGARARLDGAGIRRVWNVDIDDLALSHVHPSDVGAAIVSLDEARPWASWHRAGPGWQDETIKGSLSGAIIEGPDPGAIASRWAAALGRPASTGPESTVIHLDDAQTLVFQPGAEARLEGFCITLNNAMKALERADKLGLSSTGDGVIVGGVRLVLNND